MGVWGVQRGSHFECGDVVLSLDPVLAVTAQGQTLTPVAAGGLSASCSPSPHPCVPKCHCQPQTGLGNEDERLTNPASHSSPSPSSSGITGL